MNKLGIRAHDVGRFDAETLAKQVRDYGFEGVQLVFKKALLESVDFRHMDDIKNAFVKPKIMMLGAYFNPVHPDVGVVQEGIAYFKKHLEMANSLDADYVGSETGSLMGSPWGYVKENHSSRTLDKVIRVFKDLADHAKQHHAMIAIEGAYAHVAYDPLQIRKILDVVGSRHLKVTVDLFNYLHIGNYQNRMLIFDDCFKYLKNEIVIFHLKDFIVEDETLKQVGLGQGLMDYETIIARIKKETPDAHLIFEGVTGHDIEASMAYIRDLLERN
ncbi:MAG: sugar phosphate isomerase/epimerase [Acholeplasmataceae bacterium]|nr:sugar phosphate isomerase/epimerase [Acholeplasmataceae bacterium]